MVYAAGAFVSKTRLAKYVPKLVHPMPSKVPMTANTRASACRKVSHLAGKESEELKTTIRGMFTQERDIKREVHYHCTESSARVPKYSCDRSQIRSFAKNCHHSGDQGQNNRDGCCKGVFQHPLPEMIRL